MGIWARWFWFVKPMCQAALFLGVAFSSVWVEMIWGHRASLKFDQAVLTLIGLVFMVGLFTAPFVLCLSVAWKRRKEAS